MTEMASNSSSRKVVVTPPRSLWDLARDAQIKRQAELGAIPVELQVRDNDHARSEEVVKFAIEHLSTGGSWEELRRKLGLGPAGQDRRWRTVRAVVSETLVPKSEEEALAAQANLRSYLLDKIHNFIGDVESMISHIPNTEEDRKTTAQFMKLRLDGIKTLLEENKNSFDAYVDLRKAKSMDRHTQGPSIVIQNNFHVARPGQTPRDVLETTKAAINITQPTKLVSGNGSGSTGK